MTDPDPIAERFTRETAYHRMTVLHDDGLYRHLRFADANPDPDRRMSWSMWFDLITVPGALIFQGDGDSFVFRSTEDMFRFFLGSAWKGEPNYSYWAEKLTSGRDNVMQYDQALLERHVNDLVAEAVGEDAELFADLPRQINAYLLSEFIGDESIDRSEVEKFRYFANPDDRYKYDVRPDLVFQDTWEWNCREYDWWFRWACHAIVWGVVQYFAGCTEPREDRPPAEEQVAVPDMDPIAPTVVTVEAAGGVL